MRINESSRAWPLTIRLAALWVAFASWSGCVGWLLSAASLLNETAYLFSLIPFLFVCIWLWSATSGSAPTKKSSRHLKIVLKKRLPWIIAVSVCLVGGIIYPPSNYDGLSYRLPRILYWWQENGWYWFDHSDGRLNYSGTGFEWQMLPLLIFTRSDRLLFLLNWLPFLLFPALTFHSLRSMGVNSKTAAKWMWVIPLGYGFVLQSASIGNDSIAGIMVVASAAFSNIAIQRRSGLALIFAALAASCLTAVKLSNLPICLPLGIIWLRAAWQIRGNLLPQQIAMGIAAIPVAILSGCLPLAVLNWHYSGNWSGDPNDVDNLRITKAIPGLVGNTLNLVRGSLEPPLLPILPNAKEKILSPLRGEDSLESFVRSGFPRFSLGLGGEVPKEEGAGLGIGITLLLMVYLTKRKSNHIRQPGWYLLPMSVVIAVVVYMTKLGSESTARLMLPYYPLLFPVVFVLLPRKPSSHIFSSLAYRWLPLFCVLPALVLNPNRPLIPLRSLSNLPLFSPSMKKRINEVANGYSSRNDPLEDIRLDLEPQCREVGFAGPDGKSAYSLFKPFGSRRIIEADSGNINSFDCLVASPMGIWNRLGLDWAPWLETSGYTIQGEYDVFFRADNVPERWYLLTSKTP